MRNNVHWLTVCGLAIAAVVAYLATVPCLAEGKGVMGGAGSPYAQLRPSEKGNHDP